MSGRKSPDENQRKRKLAMSEPDLISESYPISAYGKDTDTIWSLLRMHLLKTAGCFDLFVRLQQEEEEDD